MVTWWDLLGSCCWGEFWGLSLSSEPPGEPRGHLLYSPLLLQGGQNTLTGPSPAHVCPSSKHAAAQSFLPSKPVVPSPLPEQPGGPVASRPRGLMVPKAKSARAEGVAWKRRRGAGGGSSAWDCRASFGLHRPPQPWTRPWRRRSVAWGWTWRGGPRPPPLGRLFAARELPL